MLAPALNFTEPNHINRGVAQLVARTAGARTASGSLQGSQLFKTGFERCCDGVAERDREDQNGPKVLVYSRLFNVSGCGAVGSAYGWGP
jgi:hypothetical protein